jgi:bacteriocin biosynthesis cyclodehydratase domain-containing protein
MHPLLLPGTHLLRRGDGRLQAGLGREASTILPGATRTVTELAADPAAMGALLRHGLAASDDRPVREALPADRGRDPWPRHSLAATARRTRDRFADVLAERAGHEVVPVPFGHPLSRLLAEELATVCRRSGLNASRPAGLPRHGPPATYPVHVLVGVGEPHRELLDPWLHDGTPHLVVRLVEGGVVVGPLVVPGQTACLRCLDAFAAEADPSWPLLVEQYARVTSSDRADGIPEPVDAALASIAVGWAARDVAAYLEGGTPTSWSSTVRLSAELDTIETRSWPTHPHCGCSWS